MPFLDRTARERGRELAWRSPEGTLSFLALAQRAERTARQLKTVGVEPGSVVAVKGLPGPDILRAIHGAFRAGAVAAPLNPFWGGAEEVKAVAHLAPDLVLLGEGMDPVPGSLRNLRIGTGQGEPGDSLDRLWPAPGPLPFDPDPGSRPGSDVAALLLTSGTAGAPKRVALTFGNLRASAAGSRERLALRPSDWWYASLSPAHVGGLALLTRAALLGSGLHLEGRFQAGRLQALIREGSVSHASLVPTMLHRLVEDWTEKGAPSTLRCLLLGGAPMEESLLSKALERGFPISLTYGLTEASSQVATAPPDLVAAKPGTVGPPLPGVEVRISGDGEILVRGPTVAPGQGDEHGWLHTGDLGHLDGDGHLWVAGRRSQRIISGGVNVSPAEVEAVLRTHPGVKEAVAVGIPDPEWGERVVAAVAEHQKGDVDPVELEGLVRAALSPAKRPSAFRMVSSLPRNPNGKVDVEAVRSLFIGSAS